MRLVNPAVRAARFLVPAVALAATLGPGVQAAATARCPTQTFLSFDHLAYAAQRLPASVSITPQDTLGEGTLDEPTAESGCKRRRATIAVRRAGGIDPRVAVMAGGRRSTIFVLGARCAGYDDDERWDCLLDPLVFERRRYTGTRYPAQPAPRRKLRFGGRVGAAELGGETVIVARIEGVDPSVAVGIRDWPSEAFVVPGVCPYERFENVPARDDLLRCLRSPVWLFFDPPGGRAGARLAAVSDRPLRPELDGATLSLVRLRTAADVVPANRSAAVRIGPLRAKFRLTVPDLPEGLYETVVSCPRCASRYGGKTLFPAGSFLVFEPRKGSSTPRIISLLLGTAVFALAIASIVVWRRGRRPRPREPGPGGS